MHSITIGMDISKSVFQLHGVDETGDLVIQKRLRRARVLEFFAGLQPCLVAMEACATCHYWGRELRALGHEVRLIPPTYVKPYVKRGKTDAADAAAICEAVTRPTMGFVPVKSPHAQAVLCLHKSRAQLIRQRTRLVNFMRAQMAEFGIIAPQGIGRVRELVAILQDPEDNRLPAMARLGLKPVARQLAELDCDLKDIDKAIAAHVRSSETARRLMTVPGIGPITASALVASVGDARLFRSGRHFAAWLGLTPKAHNTALKQRRGPISKMGDRYLRQMLILGATSVLRRAQPGGDAYVSFIDRLRQTKSARCVTIAAANKCARIVWALMARNDTYRAA